MKRRRKSKGTGAPFAGATAALAGKGKAAMFAAMPGPMQIPLPAAKKKR